MLKGSVGNFSRTFNMIMLIKSIIKLVLPKKRKFHLVYYNAIFKDRALFK